MARQECGKIDYVVCGCVLFVLMKVHIVYSICLKRYVVIGDFTYEPPQYAHLGSYALSHARPNTPHSADPNSHPHIWDLCPPGGNQQQSRSHARRHKKFGEREQREGQGCCSASGGWRCGKTLFYKTGLSNSL